MAQALDKVLEVVRRLSPEERQQLREQLNHDAHAASSPAQHEMQADRAAFVKSLRGKYGHVRTSSDAFNRRKQEEIEIEDRRR